MLVLGNWICKWAINVHASGNVSAYVTAVRVGGGGLVKVVVVEIARFISSRDRRAAGPVGNGGGGSSILRLYAESHTAEWR